MTGNHRRCSCVVSAGTSHTIDARKGAYMGERILRGSRLGAVSYETDRGTELAPRQSATYDCPNGHRFGVPFAAEADVPAVWECKVCGEGAVIVDGERPEPKKDERSSTLS